MRKITLMLVAVFTLTFSWQGMAQLTEGFESGLVSLTNDPSNGSDWTLNTTLYSEGLQSAHNAYASSETNSLVSGALDISTMTAPRLYFDQIAKTEGGYDYCYVEVSTDGAAWTTLATFDEDSYPEWGTSDVTPDNTWWKNEFLDLSSYISATTYVRFRLTSDTSVTRYGWLLDNVYIAEAPSCLEPSGMTATNVTDTSADLTWSASASGETAWNLEWKAGADFTPGTGAEDASDSASGTAAYNATGLSSNTTYYIYYQADCGGGDTSGWVGPFVGTTNCSPYTAPYSQNFDAETTPDVQACWNAIVSGSTSTYANVQSSTTQSASASNSIRFYNSGDTTGEYFLVSPNFLDLDNTKRIRFSAYQNIGGTDEGDVLEIGTMTDPTDPATYTSYQTIPYADLSEDAWVNLTVNFDTYAGTDSYIAIKMTFGATYNYYYFDNFYYEDIPSCLEPSALTATNFTTSGADLGWTAGAGETAWNVEIVEAGTSPTGTATATGVSNPYTESGLNASTAYEFYVQADCGGGDTSPWVGPFAFTTLCNPVSTFPWTEDFESVTTPDLPVCWDYVDNNEDGDFWKTYTGYGVGDTQAAGLYTDFNSGANDDYLILPQFTLTGNERLKFSVRARSSSEPNDYRVVLSTTGSSPGDFTEELMALTTVSSTTQTEISPIDLSAYSGDVYIAIHVPSGGLDGYYIYFDDFVVEPLPSCVEPNSLTAAATSTTDATVTWTAGGSETEWTYEYGVTGFTPGTGTTGTVSTTPSLDLTSLTPGETYDIYVQTNCSGSDSVFVTTTWSQPNLGDTCEAPIVIASVPYNTTDDTANYGDDYENGSSSCSSYYMSGDDVVYSFTPSSDGSFNIALTNIGSTYSGIHVLDGCPDSSPNCIGFDGDSTTNDRIFDVTLTGGTTYYIVISTWATPQSTTYTLDITENSCINPTVDFTVVSDCDNSGGFMIEADITDLGSATSLTISDDQGSTDQSASATGVVSFGPYANGTDVTLTVTNDQDGTCFVSSGAITQIACPPANDDCANATSLTQDTGVADAASATATPGTLEGATDSGIAAELCNGWTGTANDDVWYSFVALTTSVNITIDNTSADMVIQAYSGTCGALTNIGCSDSGNPEEINLTGLTEGNTYYFRVYQYGSGSTTGINFDAKVWTTTLGVGNSEFTGFQYYPNPVNNTLSLRAQNTIDAVSIYNLLGQEVMNVAPNAMSKDIDMSALNSGNYFVRVSINGAVETFKVIKQ